MDQYDEDEIEYINKIEVEESVVIRPTNQDILIQEDFLLS